MRLVHVFEKASRIYAMGRQRNIDANKKTQYKKRGMRKTKNNPKNNMYSIIECPGVETENGERENHNGRTEEEGKKELID